MAGDLTRSQLADLGIPAAPEVLVAGLGIERLDVRASGHGRGERTLVFTLDTAAGRDEHGVRIDVSAKLVAGACGGCDVTLRHGDGAPLARTDAGTLELREHEGRLRVWARIGATSAAEDLAVLLGRGDVGHRTRRSGGRASSPQADPPGRTTERTGAMPDVTLTLPAEARDLARRTLLADSANLLEELGDQLAGLRDDLQPSAIEVADARTTTRLLRENLDALDALGWPEGTVVS